jgi:hypothetical protein
VFERVAIRIGKVDQYYVGVLCPHKAVQLRRRPDHCDIRPAAILERIDNVAGALRVGFYNDNFKGIQYESPLRTQTAPLLSAGGLFAHQRRNLHEIALF